MDINAMENYRFSICSLVKNKGNFNRLLDSLHNNAFVNEVDEILTLDNSSDNIYDCYQAIRYFYQKSINNYIIVLHDDVTFNNDRKSLVKALKEVDRVKRDVAVYGIAGTAKSPYHSFGHFISHRGEEDWGFPKNESIDSLDECFLIINKSRSVTVSDELSGYHFYGSDICINAKKAGCECAIIDFPITHLSPGNLNDDFLKSRLLFEDHLRSIGYPKILITTCTAVYGGDNFLLKARSIAFAIFKPQVGLHHQATYVKKRLLEMVQSNKKLAFLIFIFTLYVETIGFILSVYRRIPSDIAWWKKNWKSRLTYYYKKTLIHRLISDYLWWKKNWRSRLRQYINKDDA